MSGRRSVHVTVVQEDVGMRALHVEAWGTSPTLVDVPRPTRARGCSLVGIEAATVSHLDATIATGEFAVHPDLPYIPGVEGAGVVLESDTWPLGARVMVRGAGVGVVQDGTWCEVAHVPDAALAPIPDGMDFPLGASFFVPVTTAFVALHDVCGASPTSVVQVTGARGAVGSLAVQLGLDAGCTVVAVTRDPATWAGPRSDRLIVCSPEDDVVALVGRPADCLIDTVAGPGLAERLRTVAPGGRCALVGYASAPDVVMDVPNLILADVMLVPVNMLRRDDRAREIAPGLAAKLVSGSLTLPVVAFPFEEVEQACAAVASGSTGGRVVLHLSETSGRA